MMVVPIDTDVDEAQHVSEEHRGERTQRRQALTDRSLELQYHDRDQDRDHAVAEGLESTALHCAKAHPCSASQARAAGSESNTWAFAPRFIATVSATTATYIA